MPTRQLLHFQTPTVCSHARVFEGVAGFRSVCGDAGEVSTNSDSLEVPQKWTFFTMSFRLTDHFRHSSVEGYLAHENRPSPGTL